MKKSGKRVRLDRIYQWARDSNLIATEVRRIEYGVNVHMQDGTILSIYRRLGDDGSNPEVTVVLGGTYSEETASSFHQLCAQRPRALVAAMQNPGGEW